MKEERDQGGVRVGEEVWVVGSSVMEKKEKLEVCIQGIHR